MKELLSRSSSPCDVLKDFLDLQTVDLAGY